LEEEVPEAWKELNIVPIHKKYDKIDCSNYRGISLLPITYKFISDIPAVKVNSICRGNYWVSSV
jgi:hypothetical protein